MATKLKERLALFRTAVPLVEALASASVRDWHWADVSDILNAPVNPEDGLTLQKLLDLVRWGCTLAVKAPCAHKHARTRDRL